MRLYCRKNLGQNFDPGKKTSEKIASRIQKLGITRQEIENFSAHVQNMEKNYPVKTLKSDAFLNP